MKYKYLALFFLFFLLLSQYANARNKFTVLVHVPVENEFTDRVKSFVNRELREISDVTLVDKNGDYFISIVPTPLRLTDGSTSGVALSVVCKKGTWMIHYVIIANPDEVKTSCEKIVSTFDAKFLEPDRRK